MANAAPPIRAVWPYQQPASMKMPVRAAARDGSPHRGIGLRGATSFPVLLREGPHAAHCDAVELSATGIVIERGRELSDRETRSIMKLELFLPDQERPVRVLARVVRRAGLTSYALKFVAISDVDRLTLMEHLDHEQADALRLLEEVERAAMS